MIGDTVVLYPMGRSALSRLITQIIRKMTRITRVVKIVLMAIIKLVFRINYLLPLLTERRGLRNWTEVDIVTTQK